MVRPRLTICHCRVSAQITSHGAVPFNWGEFMPAARGMLQLMKGMEETVIRAAIDSDYGAALHAFTINPLVPAGQTAKRVLDELLYAHKAHLPQFADKIAEIEANQPDVVAYVDELMHRIKCLFLKKDKPFVKNFRHKKACLKVD